MKTISKIKKRLILGFALIKSYFLFIDNLRKFNKKSGGKSFFLLWKNKKIFLRDRMSHTEFDRHYVLHPAWAARIINKIKPTKHTDISSILNFSAILSAFVPVEFYDFRPAKIKLDNLQSGRADLLSLPFSDNSIESLSCMHTIEHIGLGRYGDEIDPSGDAKAATELQRVLAINGSLLIVVPIGEEKIMFNAHRIYSQETIKNLFADLALEEFCLIPDSTTDGELVYNPSEELISQQKYACGCFWFKKISNNN